MAKKTSQNAVKQIDEQIDMLSSTTKSRRSGDTSTINKDSLKKEISKSTAKKSTTKKKTTSSTTKKTTSSAAKKSTSSTTKKTAIKEKPSTTKKTTTKTTKSTAKTTSSNVRGEVVVVPSKRGRPSTKKPSTTTDKNVRGEVVIAPNKRKKSTTTTKKTSTKKVDPKVLNEHVEEIINDIDNIEVVPSSADIENIEIVSKSADIDLDKTEIIDLKDTKEEKIPEYEYDDLKLDKPIDLDNLEELDDYKIIEDFENDFYQDNKVDTKNDKKKKKFFSGKKNTSYKELEDDLRSLYDKVNDVISDIDGTPNTKKVEVPRPKNYKDIDGTSSPKKRDVPRPKSYKDIDRASRKHKPVSDEHEEKPERKILLDYISQKFLNVILVLLFIVFLAMVIAFVWFVIYVSTF